jgi:hypothetical protein
MTLQELDITIDGLDYLGSVFSEQGCQVRNALFNNEEIGVFQRR